MLFVSARDAWKQLVVAVLVSCLLPARVQSYLWHGCWEVPHACIMLGLSQL